MTVFQSKLMPLLLLVVMILAPCPAHAFLRDNSSNSMNGSIKKDEVSRLIRQALQNMPHYECATAAVMAGLGDLLAQMRHHRKHNKEDSPSTTTTSSLPLLVGENKDDDPVAAAASFSVNWKRTYQFMFKGFGEGLLWTIWYRNAEHWTVAITRRLTKTASGRVIRPFWVTLVATIVALVLDLILACPVIYATWDIPLPALLRGTPLSQIPQQIRDKIGDMLVASVKVWTPVNILIYNVPVQYRVYINSFADVFWQSIVSSIVSSPAAWEAVLLEPSVLVQAKTVRGAR